MKRKIDFVAKTYKSYKTQSVTVKIPSVRRYKLKQSHLKTDIGYVDLTVELDRWGRLNAVLVERTERV